MVKKKSKIRCNSVVISHAKVQNKISLAHLPRCCQSIVLPDCACSACMRMNMNCKKYGFGHIRGNGKTSKEGSGSLRGGCNLTDVLLG